ncbi:MerR family transcriptional regulator [Nocardia goodfellowii]|uniref:DNA-binding transcriptional MerR regulator n=1 Tax=Nocardia goodfellowii TaxID=882446 RepID=A0ABS4QRC4_9NOCA|nr:MerR family transcriptional regulator [Nocardia goodfellowii]MBP2193196.1 DNA-binding transcriptional MerR regulator [Nocardia goodfellowii]
MAEQKREYRVAELAEAAAVPVRTVRYYQERGLLAAPERRGRHAIYDNSHLERLTLIADLLARGHSLEGIADLITSAESGGGVSELLGFESIAATSWGGQEIRVELEQLLARFGDQVTEQNVAEAVALGYLRVDGADFYYASQSLLDSATTFVAAGYPLRSLLALSWELEAAFDRMAFAFMQEFRTHLLGPVLRYPSPTHVHDLGAALTELRPAVHQVVDELMARAMDRRIAVDLPEVAEQLSRASEPDPARNSLRD